jgi:hypothetical protein
MGWVIAGAGAWLLLAVGFALVIGRSIRNADREAAERTDDKLDLVVDLPPVTMLRAVDEPARDSAQDGCPAADGPPSPGARPVRNPSTIPGIPSARPSVGRPAVPRSTRRRPPRESGTG